MSNGSFPLFATPLPNIGVSLVQVSEYLARGICPSCGREFPSTCWSERQDSAWSCNTCGFNLAYDPDESRQPTPQGELPQSLLWELFVLRRLDQQQKSIRSRILAMSDAGRPVEPGHFGLRIVESTRQQITLNVIRGILGQDAVDTLNQLAPITEIRTVFLGAPSVEFTASSLSEER